MDENVKIIMTDKDRVIVDLDEYNKMRDELYILRRFKDESNFVLFGRGGYFSRQEYYMTNEPFFERIKSLVQNEINDCVVKYASDTRKEKENNGEMWSSDYKVKENKKDTLADCLLRLFKFSK